MAGHELGSKSNGQLRAPSPVGRAAPPVVKAGSAQPAPKSTLARGFGSPGIPSFDDDPIGAISFALREVGAALQGKQLPSEKASAAAFEQQSQRLAMTNTRFKILKEGAGILKNLPIEQHEDFLATIRIPEIKEMLQAASEGLLENFEDNLFYLANHPGALIDISEVELAAGSTPQQINDRVDAHRKVDLEIDAARQKEAIKAEFREPPDVFSRPTVNDRGQLVQTNDEGQVFVVDQEQDEFSQPFRNEDGDLVQLNTRTKKMVVLSKTGKTSFDIKARQGRKDEAVQNLQEGVSAIANISITMDELEKASSAGGLSGLAIEKIGGFLGQFSEAAEEGFAAFFGDATPQEVQAIRTRARVIVAQMLSEITGEESGRFTEAERALAVEALKSLDPNASPTQIRSALAVGLELQLLSRDRQLTVAGVTPKFDLETKEGKNSKGEELENLGLKPIEILPILKRMILQRRLMKGIQ